MKAKELAELLLEHPDQNVFVSVDVSTGKEDSELRAIGSIIEVINNKYEINLRCAGTTIHTPLLPPRVRESFLAALGIPPEFLGLEPSDKKLLDDLKRLWANACTVARSYCPVPNVGDNHITQGIPLLAKRAADAEAERDKLLAQIDAYRDDRRSLEPLHWAFAEYDNFKPLRKVLYEKPEEALMQQMDMKIFEELSIKSSVKENAELKKMEVIVGCASQDGENWKTLSPDMNKELLKELERKTDMEVIEELTVASLIKERDDLKAEVERLKGEVARLQKILDMEDAEIMGAIGVFDRG